MKRQASILTPEALRAVLSSAKEPAPRIAPTVIFNLLNVAVPVVSGEMKNATPFYGARAMAVISEKLTVLSNIGMGSSALAFYFEMARVCGAHRFILLGQAGSVQLGNSGETDEIAIGQIAAPEVALGAPSLIEQYDHDCENLEIAETLNLLKFQRLSFRSERADCRHYCTDQEYASAQFLFAIFARH